jgi:hypothetical protein
VREVRLEFPREFVEFPDPADTAHWIRADLTWLCSRWSCIFGRGCRGIGGDPITGCCDHGAYFTDKDDERRVRRFAEQLTDTDWQFRKLAWRGGRLRFSEKVEDDAENRRKTRVIDGACIFANREEHEGGIGCALHAFALRAGHDPVETKPDVCWQLPIRREQDWVDRPDGTRILRTTLTEFDRRSWGDGGHDLNWYCTGSPDAHTGARPLYESYRPELIALIGKPAYEQLVALCAKRLKLGLVAVHPATAAAKGHISNL